MSVDFSIIFRIKNKLLGLKWDPELLYPPLAGYHTSQIFHWTVFFLHMAPVYIYFIYFVLFFMRTFNKNQNQKARWKGRGWKKKQTSFLTALVKNAKKPKEMKQKNESRNARVKNIYEKN